MNDFVPYEKMSKKQRRAVDRQRRGGWNGLCPVTRVVQSGRGRIPRKCKHKKEAAPTEW